MSDVVERIRNRINDAPMPTEHLLDEAADTITGLRAEVARMREALERIVDAPMIDHANPERGAQAIARAALSSITGDE